MWEENCLIGSEVKSLLSQCALSQSVHLTNIKTVVSDVFFFYYKAEMVVRPAHDVRSAQQFIYSTN